MKTPKTRTLIVITIISTVISFSLIAFHVREEYRNRLGYYNEELNEYFEPEDAYIKDLKKVMNKEIESPWFASECIVSLTIGYNERAIPYQMFLAECFDDPESCGLFYMTIKDFYHSFECEIPQLVMEFAIGLLKKGAEYCIANNDPYEYNRYRVFHSMGCCDDLVNIYEDGKYVPRDTVLVNYYRKLGKQRQCEYRRMKPSDN